MRARHALADRIEDNLGTLLTRAEAILRDNERHVLALAHALETHKTLSGEDVTAVFEGGRGPLVDGAPYADDEFIAQLREYHLAAKRAHREHNQPQLPMPTPAVRPGSTACSSPTGTVARPTGRRTASRTAPPTGQRPSRPTGPKRPGDADRHGRRPSAPGTPNGTGDGTANGSYGTPTYEPPLYGPPDGSLGGQA